MTDGDLDWARDAECAKPENSHVAFFDQVTPEQKNEAKNLCFACPVRKDCIKYALERNTGDGVWGGRDENELRRTLSINSDGEPVRRGRFPQCPYCSARTSKLLVKIIDLPGGGRWTTAKVVECTICHFEWRSRSSAEAVTAYFTARAEKIAKSERRRTKKAAAE